MKKRDFYIYCPDALRTYIIRRGETSDIVSGATRWHEQCAAKGHAMLNPKISWRFRAATMIKMAHVPRRPGEPITATNLRAIY